jgi:NAD+ kinase
MAQQNQGIDQSKLSPSSPYFPRSTTTNTTATTSASRIRNPAPPSPLSQIQPQPDTGESSSRSVHTPSSSTVPTGNAVPVSPCFIHSHLDRTGTLQDWLGSGTGTGGGSGTQSTPRTNGPTHRSGSNMHQASSSRHPRIPGHQARQVLHHAQPPTDSSAGSSRVTSPTDKRGTSMSGYESDKSSVMGGSALLDGDIIDDDDDTGSLTRQLAETAQGVREMSKQLGTYPSLGKE